MNKMALFSIRLGWRREINRSSLVNKHGDLYFLLQNSSVKIVLFDLDNFTKKFIGGKKLNDMQKRYSRTQIMTLKTTA